MDLTLIYQFREIMRLRNRNYLRQLFRASGAATVAAMLSAAQESAATSTSTPGLGVCSTRKAKTLIVRRYQVGNIATGYQRWTGTGKRDANFKFWCPLDEQSFQVFRRHPDPI